MFTVEGTTEIIEASEFQAIRTQKGQCGWCMEEAESMTQTKTFHRGQWFFSDARCSEACHEEARSDGW